jgi:hypothetical protein
VSEWTVLGYALRNVLGLLVVCTPRIPEVPQNQQTNILRTNLAELTPGQIVCIYQKRWAIKLLNWELKSGMGLGEHQANDAEKRLEQSVGIAVMASLFLLRACHHEIVPGKPWSIFQLQQAFRLRVMTNQVEHKVKR